MPLCDVSLHARPGELAADVGESGPGEAPAVDHHRTDNGLLRKLLESAVPPANILSADARNFRRIAHEPTYGTVKQREKSLSTMRAIQQGETPPFPGQQSVATLFA